MVERLNKFDGNAKEAFKEPFYKPNKQGKTGAIVKKVKIENKISSFVILNNGRALAENDSMVRIDVFYVENEGYYFVPIYTKHIVEKVLPNKASVAHKSENEWKVMDEKCFIFSLYPNDLIYIRAKRPIEFVPSENKELNKISFDSVFCYYAASNIATASIKVRTHDNKYERDGLGIKTLLEIKKYQVDILGEYHEVKLPEKRNDFRNMKGGKKA